MSTVVPAFLELSVPGDRHHSDQHALPKHTDGKVGEPEEQPHRGGVFPEETVELKSRSIS